MLYNKIDIRKLSILLIGFTAILILSSWAETDPSKKGKHIPKSEQRDGDPEAGKDYLFSGNYVNSGIPADLFGLMKSGKGDNILGREGMNADLPPNFTAVQIDDTTQIVAPNCLTCHSDYINGKLVVGLGNTTFDYTFDLSKTTPFISMTVAGRFGKNSSEWHAFEPFKKASEKINPEIKTEVRGINPADKLTSALVAHRDPKTLMWSDSALLTIPDGTIPTDVPPWWVLRKKNAMFYTGIGRGDFSKFLMASSLLTLKDTTEAREIDQYFPSVLSWINTLEPPAYPFEIEEDLAKTGERLFELNCSKCHGTYNDKEEDYPNLLIPLDVIGTDRTLSDAYTETTYKPFIEWYNESWFSQGSNPGKLVAEGGYVAQPLDGIWASAPYFHNGSVPNLELVLNSKLRPPYWSRSFESTDYDSINVGWNFESQESKLNSHTYDTNLKGYGNAGHTFGDDLSDAERKCIIEYLKTI